MNAHLIVGKLSQLYQFKGLTRDDWEVLEPIFCKYKQTLDYKQLSEKEIETIVVLFGKYFTRS